MLAAVWPLSRSLSGIPFGAMLPGACFVVDVAVGGGAPEGSCPSGLPVACNAVAPPESYSSGLRHSADPQKESELATIVEAT